MAHRELFAYLRLRNTLLYLLTYLLTVVDPEWGSGPSTIELAYIWRSENLRFRIGLRFAKIQS